MKRHRIPKRLPVGKCCALHVEKYPGDAIIKIIHIMVGEFDVMLKHVIPEKLNDLFTPVSGRREKGAYFCRIAGYSPAVERFIKEYYDAARRTGVILSLIHI